MRDEFSRRAALRIGGGTLAAAGAAGLAGCTAGILGDDPSGPDLDAWLVEPSVAGESAGDRSFEYVVPEVVFEHDAELSYDRLSLGAGIRDRIGVPAAEIEWILQQSSTTNVVVLAGSFDAEAAEDSLRDWADDEDRTISSEGEFDGFELYDVDDVQGYAVGDDHVAAASVASEDDDPIDVIEDVLAGQAGDSTRWSDDDDAAALLDALPTNHFAGGTVRDEPQTDDEDGTVQEWQDGLLGTAESQAVDGDTTDVTNVLLYDTDDDVDTAAVETYVDGQRDVGDDYATLTDYTVDADGRVVTVSGTVRTRAYT